MDYHQLSDLERLMNNQIKYLDYMEQLIKFDQEYVEANPGIDLPPLQNIGVLKSHFTTQRKACEGVLSIAARHLPRLKTEKEAQEAQKKADAKKDKKTSKASPPPAALQLPDEPDEPAETATPELSIQSLF